VYTVVIPVLNEAENLKELLPRLSKDCEVIVCDNGSSDESVKVAESLGAKVSRGMGSVSTAIQRGIDLASNDRVVVMDADLSHPPEKVPEIAKGLLEHDMVVGSRYCRGGVSKDGFSNRILSWLGCLATKFIQSGVKDPMSGFFGIRKSNINFRMKDTYKPMLEYLVRTSPTSVFEVPIDFQLRTWGETKFTRWKNIAGPLKAVSLLYLHKYQRLIKFLFVGASGVVVAGVALYLLTEFAGLHYLLSMGIACWLSNFNNFVWNEVWTFSDRREHSQIVSRYFKFLTIYGSTAIIDILLVGILTGIGGVWYMASFLVIVALTTILRFLISYFLVWRGDYSLLSSKTLNQVWNMGHSNDEGDFDWWEWYGGHPIKRFWKRRMGRLVKELAGDPVSVLSLGCGSSPILNQFSGERCGVDSNSRKIDFFSQHTTAELRVGDVTKMSLDGTYDTVLCNEVLEHLGLENLEKAIFYIAGSSSNMAVISIPDYGSRLGRWLEGLFHGGLHEGLSVDQLDEVCATYGLRKVEEKRWLWDTAILYKKVV